jgi:hypothetical protein
MSLRVRMFVALTLCMVLPGIVGLLWDRPANNAMEGAIELDDITLQAECTPDTLRSILADNFIDFGSGNYDQHQPGRTQCSDSGQGRLFNNIRVRTHGRADGGQDCRW